MNKIFEKIAACAEWGIHLETPMHKADTLRIVNVFLLFLFSASIVETIILLFSGARTAALINASAPLIFGSGLLMMRAGYSSLARVLVFAVSYSFTYVLLGVLGPDTYFEVILIFASTFSVLFFSPEEKWPLAFAICAPLVCLAVLEVTHYQPVFGLSRANLVGGNLRLVRLLSMFTIWFLMYLHFLYFLRGRRQVQEQLVNSAKMVAAGRMAAAVAHEVNNPLQLIMSYAERLKQKASAPLIDRLELPTLAEQIQNVAMRLANVNKGLLTISHGSSTEPFIEVSVNELISNAIEIYRAEFLLSRIELHISPSDSKWSIRAQPALLSQVITNLLNNAYDSVMELETRRIDLKIAALDGWVEISFCNSGIPIDADTQKRIFEPFYTTKPFGKGTGLGLNISRGIILQHGGKIYYDSRAESPCFIVTIPRGSDII